MATRKELLRRDIRTYGSDPGVQTAYNLARSGQGSYADIQRAIQQSVSQRQSALPPTNTSLVPGASPPPMFGGEAGQFLQNLYQARPAFVQQQGELLQSMGPTLRSAVFNASPELAQASGYLQQTFADPFGGALSTYQDALRGAQASRGFGGAQGTGPAGEEARYLTNFAEQRRMQLLPQLQGFGQQVLNISGLGAPPDLELAGIGSLALSSRRLELERQAGERQSEIAQQLFNQYQQSLGGGGRRTGGGTVSFYSSSSEQNLANANYNAPFASTAEAYYNYLQQRKAQGFYGG